MKTDKMLEKKPSYSGELEAVGSASDRRLLLLLLLLLLLAAAAAAVAAVVVAVVGGDAVGASTGTRDGAAAVTGAAAVRLIHGPTPGAQPAAHGLCLKL